MEWYFGQSGTLERASGSSFGASWRGVLALVGPLVTFLSALGPLWGLSWWAPPLLGHSWGSLGGLKGRPGARHWVPRGGLVVPRGPQGVLKGSPRGPKGSPRFSQGVTKGSPRCKNVCGEGCNVRYDLEWLSGCWCVVVVVAAALTSGSCRSIC